MDRIWIYLLQIFITAAICLTLVVYFRPVLRSVLVDLCGTPERAQFWVVFSGILLMGLPLIFALGFDPGKSAPALLFFEIARQLRLNLLGFLLALIAIGGAVSFFALVAPRPSSK